MWSYPYVDGHGTVDSPEETMHSVALRAWYHGSSNKCLRDSWFYPTGIPEISAAAISFLLRPTRVWQ